MSSAGNPSCAVVGGGPAGLMAAEVMAAAGVAVTVYDRMPSLGRKLLMAGRGGLNLTHSEPLDRFLARYGERETALTPAIQAWTPDDARRWCEGLGQETFVGSSGRVFPKAMKASPLLRAWLARLAARSVAVETRHRWRGWSNDGRALIFDTPGGTREVTPDATILALGGASWPRLGSDGSWTSIFAEAGIPVHPLAPSNCGFRIDWSEIFRKKFSGAPFKRIGVTHGPDTAVGEAVVTETGIEGGVIYALSAALRRAIAQHGSADIAIDLRPGVPLEELTRHLQRPRAKQSLASFLRKAGGLHPMATGLLYEAALTMPQPLGQLDPSALAVLMKAVPLRLIATAPIDRAISTAGGIAFDAVDTSFMLRARPGTFVAGEMLDWEAPTGGYLLQACLATGAAAGRGACAWLQRSS